MGLLSSCWESCSKTRVKAKSNDHTEKAQFVGHVIMALLQIVAIQGGFQLFILGLHAASDGPPRDVEYGWACSTSFVPVYILSRLFTLNLFSIQQMVSPQNQCSIRLVNNVNQYRFRHD